MKTNISDFRFIKTGFGFYRVTYHSPATAKQWSTVVNNMPLIDATKNEDNPKQKDLETLKFMCKL